MEMYLVPNNFVATQLTQITRQERVQRSQQFVQERGRTSQPLPVKYQRMSDLYQNSGMAQVKFCFASTLHKATTHSRH